MARDEALLDGFRTVLRRTAWDEPSATIGRFQPWSILQHPTLEPASCAPVRRITGGGAIFHGDDLTLGWVATCPSPLFPDRNPTAIASRAAGALIPAITPFHPGARTRDGEFAERAQRTITDCFARTTPFDLVVENGEGELEKVGGLALHRRGERILVQASIRRGIHLTAESDAEVLRAVASGIGAEVEEIGDLDDFEEQRSVELAHWRYARHEWNRRIRLRPEAAVQAVITTEDSNSRDS